MVAMRSTKHSALGLAMLFVVTTLLVTLGPFTGQTEGQGNQQPLRVRDVDNPVRQPFQSSGFVSFSGQFGEEVVAVPTGKALVIEHVTGHIVVPGGQTPPQYISVATTLGGNTADHNFPVAYLTSAGTSTSPIDVYAVASAARLYSGAGTTSVTIRGIRTNLTGNASFSFSISGYLVNCGSGDGCPIP
jgi:hypothetical protein